MIRLPKWLLAVLALALFAGLTLPVLAADEAKRDQSADKAKRDQAADKANQNQSTDKAQKDQTSGANHEQAADTTNGKVERVDAEQHQFVVRDKNNVDWTFELGHNAQVQLNGKESQLADLKKGDEVSIRYHAMARAINTGPQEKGMETTRGRIERVDADNNQLVLKDREGKEYTFRLGQNARVRSNGQDGKLADLKQGEVASITFSKDGNQLTVRRIRAGRQEQAMRAAEGTIERVQADNHELVLRDRNGKRHSFQISQDARVRVNGQDSKLSDLKTGEAATVNYRLVANDVHTPGSK